MPEEEKQEQTPQKSDQKQPAKVSSGSNKTLIIVVVIVVGLVLLSGIGYFVQQQFSQKAAEKAVETATGGKVDISGGGDKVTIETNEGKVTIGQNEVPDSFPSDITVYSGAKVTGSTESSAGISIVLETSDSVSKVSDFYKADLEKNGWKINATTNIGGSTSYSAEKGAKSVVIVAAPSDNITNISITVADK